MRKLLRNKPIENYPNNIQRNMTIEEYCKALKLYAEFVETSKDYIGKPFGVIEDKLRHNNNCSIDYRDNNFIDVFYGDETKDDMVIFVSFKHNDVEESFISKSFLIFIKDLEYEYTISLNEDIYAE